MRGRRTTLIARGLCLAWLAVTACRDGQASPESDARDPRAVAAVPVEPPFAVRGDAEGLLLVWLDHTGAAHGATSRSEVPAERREHVRVDSLELAPEQRLDPAHVYVADLRKPGPDGSYAVQKWLREDFEALGASLAPAAATGAAAAGTDDVILYGASWCGACKQAARFMQERGIAFVEKDIEREPAARQEMMAKARAQGVATGSIPIIDARGKLLAGFQPHALLSALERAD